MCCSGIVRRVVVFLILASLLSAPALAGPLAGTGRSFAPAPLVEVKTGLEAGKLCTVVRSCNFSRKAAVRGCLSSYACRQCDFVKRCSKGKCEWRSRCGWGSAGS
ncbi:MAG: hypothetical protein R3D57_19420 [Hyphomicrobiaceae bacterium]